jgi:hypothetical protein
MKSKLQLLCVALTVSVISFGQTTTTLRSDGVMLLNGQPFFPVGYYAESFNTLTSVNYAANSMAAAGFNIIFNEHDIQLTSAEFGSFLDNCASKGIYNIISFYETSTAVDARMNAFIPAFKNKPSVAVWCIADDASTLGTEADIIRKHNLAKSLDPNHLTYQATNGGVVKDAPVAVVDMTGTEHYCIFNPNDNRIDGYGTWDYLTTCVSKCAANNKLPFEIGQAFIFGYTYPNTQGYTFPTAAQCDAQSYMSIVAGMKGLMYFTFQDYYGSTINVSQPEYWNASARVANEIQGTLKNVLLNGTRTTVADAANHVYYARWLYNGDTYVIAVNADFVSHAVSIPVTGTTLTKVFSYRNGTMSLSNNNLSGTLGSLDVQIYKVAASSAGNVNVTAASNTICSGTSTTLTASNATTYSWSPATGLSSTTGAAVTASPATTTTYTVTGTDAGSTTTASITITVNAAPATPAINKNSCNALMSSSATGNQWYLNGTAISGAAAQNYSPTQTGNYTVDVNNGTCKSAKSAAYNYTLTPFTETATCTSGITVDGNLNETIWAGASQSLCKPFAGTGTQATAAFKTRWDNQYFYIGADVTDATLNTASPNIWENTAVEIWLDMNNGKTATYEANDFQYIVGWNNTTLFEVNNRTTGVLFKTTDKTGGYILEMAIPFTTLGVTASPGAIYGFDLGVDVSHTPGIRTDGIIWSGDNTNSQSTSKWGIVNTNGTCSSNSTVFFTEDNTNFPNPERGLPMRVDPPWPANIDWTPCNPPFTPNQYAYSEFTPALNLTELQNLRNTGQTLVMMRHHIGAFRTAAISQTYLNRLQQDFNTARQAGVKLTIRFVYNYPFGGPDASINFILPHLDQLKPLLVQNSDVIAFIEFGLIGCWGEMHTTINDLMSVNLGYRRINNNTITLLNKLFETVPQERMIVIRYPEYKFQFFNGLGNNAQAENKPIAPLTNTEAFNGSIKARWGQYDDCVACGEWNAGTYLNPHSTANGKAPEVQDFLSKDNLYVVQSGEVGATCCAQTNNGVDEDGDGYGTDYESCTRMVALFKKEHFSTINHNDDPVRVEKWKTQGCYDEITKKLGYRFVLTKGFFPENVTAGSNLEMNFEVKNTGWASPFNPRGMEIILRNKNTLRNEAIIVLNNGTTTSLIKEYDPRFWQPDSTVVVNVNYQLPSSIPQGNYEVLLHLFDPTTSLYGRPEYSIRLANQNVWEPSTGYNLLHSSINITGTVLAFKTETATAKKNTAVAAVKIYPNPAKQNTIISYGLTQYSPVKITVVDLLGKELITVINEKQSKGNYQLNVNTNSLPAGLYLVKIIVNGIQQSEKLIIDR